jgi:hypothetical protein
MSGGREIFMPGCWGLYDTIDGVWMGDDSGPKTFDDFLVARIAAELVDIQLGQQPRRTQAKEYEHGPKRLRDHVDTKMSTLEALEGKESGRFM